MSSAVRAISFTGSLLLACFALPFTSSSAVAGQYSMYTCGSPVGGPSVGTSLWTVQNTQHGIGYDDCQSGSPSFGVRFPAFNQMAAGTEVRWTLNVPPTGPESQIRIRSARVDYDAELAASSGLLFIGATGAAGGGKEGSIAGPNSFKGIWQSADLGAGTRSFSVFLYCGGGGGCAPVSSLPLKVVGVDLSLEEFEPPSATLIGGTLLSGAQAPIQGVRTASFEAADLASGVSKVELLLNNQVVAVTDYGPNCRHVGWSACNQSETGTFSVDTSGVVPGMYVVQLRVTDAAGNRRTVQGAQPVAIGISGATGSPTAKLEARFSGLKGSTITKNWASTAVVSGRLITLSGAPIGNAQINLIETVNGKGNRSRPIAKTRANGRFTYRIRARQSSRRVRFQYLAPGSVPVVKDMRVRVRSASKLRASLRGVTLSYSGVVKSRPLPAKGKLVYIQGRAKGASWQTFATRRASRRSGVFSGRYRLRVRRPGVLLQFRAVVPSEAGYPYEASTGAVVTRRVR